MWGKAPRRHLAATAGTRHLRVGGWACMWLKVAKARWECTLVRQSVCCCSVAKPMMVRQPRHQRATTPAPGPALWAAPRCQTRLSCCPSPRVAAAAAPPAAASRRRWLSGAAHQLGRPAMDQSRVQCVSLQVLSYPKAGGCLHASGMPRALAPRRGRRHTPCSTPNTLHASPRPSAQPGAPRAPHR